MKGEPAGPPLHGQDFVFFLNSALLAQLGLKLIRWKVCAGLKKRQQWIIVIADVFGREAGIIVNRVWADLKIGKGGGVHQGLDEFLDAALLRRRALHEFHAHSGTGVHDADNSFNLELKLTDLHHQLKTCADGKG